MMKAVALPARGGRLLVGSRVALRLGVVPFSDSAALLVARDFGLFGREGLEVALTREVGWAALREKLCYGELDAAVMPTPQLFRLRQGWDCAPCEVLSSFVCSVGGSAVTLGVGLRRAGVRSAGDLKRVLRSKHPWRPVLAVDSLYSCEYFLLRQWLLSGGIDPDKDIALGVLPPTQLLGSLESGQIDGFCSAEPWNSAAVQAGVGWCPATSVSLGADHPAKVLVVRSAFAERWPEEHGALLRALDEASGWCEEPSHRSTLVDLLGASPWFRECRAALRPALIGPFDGGDGQRVEAADWLRFYGAGANAPTAEQEAWVLGQLREAKLLGAEWGAEGAFRPDLLAAALGGAAGRREGAGGRRARAAS